MQYLKVFNFSHVIDSEHSHGPSADLQRLKDYTGESLTRCSEDAFQSLFVPTEKIFRLFMNSNDKKSSKILIFLINLAENETQNVILPYCHDLKSKILKYFLSVSIKQSLKLFRNSLKTEKKNRLKSSQCLAMARNCRYERFCSKNCLMFC